MLSKLKPLLRKHRKPITFAGIGVINTGVDFLVFSLLIYLGISVLIGQAAGYICGLICSFLLNKFITFRNKSRNFAQILLFLLVNFVTLLISVGLIHLFVYTLELQEHAAKIFLITPVTMVLNYLGYKYIVFK